MNATEAKLLQATHDAVTTLVAEFGEVKEQVDRNRDAIEGKRGLNANVRLLLWGGSILTGFIVTLIGGVALATVVKVLGSE